MPKRSVAAPMLDPLYDEKTLGERLGISPLTARGWRHRGDGPPFVRVGRLVRYRESDVTTWLSSRLVRSTSEMSARAAR